MSVKQIIDIRSFKLRFFLYFLLFGVLIELITVGVVYVLDNMALYDEMDKKYEVEIKQKLTLLQKVMSDPQRSIDGLVGNRMFIDYLSQPNAKNRQQLTDLFLYASEDMPSYVQVRFLDKYGQEQIRIDREGFGKTSVVVPNDKLQNKADRYYVLDIMAAGRDSLWFSNLDLNVERGEIETPYRPMLRVGKPVYYQDRLRGLVIINIDMKQALLQLVQATDFDVALVDAQGRYIYSSEAGKSWSEMLGTNANILASLEGVSALDRHEFRTQNTFFYSLSDIIPNEQQSYLVLRYKEKILAEIRRQNFYAALWILFLVIALSLPLTYFISNVPLALQQRLYEALARLQQFSAIIDQHVMTLTLTQQGSIVAASQALCKRGDFTETDLEGKPYSFLLEGPESDTGDAWKQEGEAIGYDRHGENFWVEQTVAHEVVDSNDVKYYTIVLTDVTVRKEFERRSVTDSLTGLSNRAAISNALQRELEQAKRYSTIFSIVLIDVDFFKRVNDTLGHQAGDRVLIGLAERMMSIVRASDICGRFGGEEFIVILPQTGEEGARSFAEKLRLAVQDQGFGVDVPVTASFGVTTCRTGDSEESLLKRVDIALYKAKESGRNQVIVADEKE